MKKILKLFTIADIILIVILLAVSGIMLINMKSDLTNKKVEISYHNELVGIYSLNESRIIDIDAGIQVEIDNNKIRIKRNTCAHQYCVQQGWSDGLPVICVPNEVSIVFISKKEEMLITR